MLVLGFDSGRTAVSNFVPLCALRIWAISLAFSFTFGALFAKVWDFPAPMNNVCLFVRPFVSLFSS